jgi:hypothetical protein
MRELSEKSLANPSDAISKRQSWFASYRSWWFRNFNGRGEPEGVASRVCARLRDATFRFGPQKEHSQNPRYPRSSSAFGPGCAGSDFTGAWMLELGAFNPVLRCPHPTEDPIGACRSAETCATASHDNPQLATDPDHQSPITNRYSQWPADQTQPREVRSQWPGT